MNKKKTIIWLPGDSRQPKPIIKPGSEWERWFTSVDGPELVTVFQTLDDRDHEVSSETLKKLMKNIGMSSATAASFIVQAAAYRTLASDLDSSDKGIESLPREPPKLAEFVLTAFATSAKREAIRGDLAEIFARECCQLGAARAKRLYWARTLRSLAPLLCRAAVKAMKWGALIDVVRRHL
jgi:hypothetical protein